MNLQIIILDVNSFFEKNLFFLNFLVLTLDKSIEKRYYINMKKIELISNFKDRFGEALRIKGVRQIDLVNKTRD